MVHSLSRALRASGCYNCRVSLIRTFTAITGISSPQSQLQPRCPRPVNRCQARHSSEFRQLDTTAPKDFEDGGKQAHETNGKEEIFDAKDGGSSSVPWYMQVEHSLKPPRPLSERQRIPELPETPPPILQPLLQHISVDLGLDDLSLLDLRNLDPPPALGANLLMIIGTARSEKHLHVSADRLCRWLRSEYKLRPDADGLLGRNELKLKIRRKNRRVKLLGSDTANESLDDGVRTGWVCVNVGTVEGPAAVTEVCQVEEGYVGFGKQTKGVKIVVQMLVEDKRRELDLEKLWSGIAKRRSLLDSAPELEPGNEPLNDLASQPDIIGDSRLINKPLGSLNYYQKSTSTVLSPIVVQSRSIHTTTARSFTALQMKPSIAAHSKSTVSKLYMPDNSDVTSIQQRIMPLLELGDYHAARLMVMECSRFLPVLQNERWRIFFLGSLKTHLENISYEQATRELGHGFNDYSSTSFLRCVHETMSSFPSALEWDFQIWLHCFARKIGHLGYTTQGLSQIFASLQESGQTIAIDTYINLLRSTLEPLGDSRISWNIPPGESQLQMAAEILQDMHDRVGNILTEEVLLALQESMAVLPSAGDLSNRLVDIPNAAITTCDLPTLESSGALERLNDLMSALHLKVNRDDTRIRLMNTYANQYNWEEFWRIWRSVLRMGGTRSPALYACMFQRVAESSHQKGCINVLRTWIPEMDMEEPRVILEGEVLEAVRTCLAIADPSGEEAATNNAEVGGEWHTLWRRCLENIA